MRTLAEKTERKLIKMQDCSYVWIAGACGKFFKAQGLGADLLTDTPDLCNILICTFYHKVQLDHFPLQYTFLASHCAMHYILAITS